MVPSFIVLCLILDSRQNDHVKNLIKGDDFSHGSVATSNCLDEPPVLNVQNEGKAVILRFNHDIPSRNPASKLVHTNSILALMNLGERQDGIGMPEGLGSTLYVVSKTIEFLGFRGTGTQFLNQRILNRVWDEGFPFVVVGAIKESNRFFQLLHAHVFRITYLHCFMMLRFAPSKHCFPVMFPSLSTAGTEICMKPPSKL